MMSPILKEGLLKMKYCWLLTHLMGIDKNVNHSFITLILKKDSPFGLDDFRLISSVGGVYEILTNMLLSRLITLVDKLIRECQFAFILRRQILDCSLIANEVLDYVRRNMLQGVAFKVDFQKAYDTVDWDFLEFVMIKICFGNRWCKWIRPCMPTASISIFVDGLLIECFYIKRGLRQGCPLSPLFFYVVAEALNVMLSKAVNSGLYNRVVVVGNSIASVSHFQSF
ncbi:reverse transcriptase [Gossypium australe]|uniref:Reverse transcriptase n=1 Tax=Gossypium australe TaxID=47621 RepID=A0A5B6VPR4_9ROSI|nr:reverse transcriptase [Gossypium australe]